MNELTKKNDVIKEKSVVTPEMVKKAIVGETPIPTFSKTQIVKSLKYATRRDALNVLLDEKKTYSFTEVDEILKKFEGGN